MRFSKSLIFPLGPWPEAIDRVGGGDVLFLVFLFQFYVCKFGFPFAFVSAKALYIFMWC